MKAIHGLAWVCTALIGMTIAVADAQPPSANARGELSGPDGLVLYTYDPDGTSGQSQCTGACAALWPPFAAAIHAKSAGGFSVITRPDHTLQWAFDGRPLYRYAGDSKPGFANGDGINGSWHIAHAH